LKFNGPNANIKNRLLGTNLFISCMDKSLSGAQFKALKTAFECYRCKDQGTIDIVGAFQAAHQAGIRFSHEERNALLSRPRRLDFGAYLVMMTLKIQRDYSVSCGIFRHLDIDGDGLLTASDLRTAFAQHQISDKEKDLRRLLSLVNPTHPSISLDEFTRLYSS
jgi:Ca2+-binding EF-hand superfamily protein